MKRKWRQRGKGAISIFLIIIFLANYMFAALLVDGARYRMAQAMAESALDSASASVLSYYNRLLNDLYGLFATDSLSEEEITTLLKGYVEQTLGVAEIDTVGAKTLVDTIFGTVSGEEKKYLDGYGFALEPKAQMSVSLANTDFVQYQIVEHMKLRGPVALVESGTGFLGKIKGMISLKERIQAVQEKTELTNGKQGIFAKADATSQSINAYGPKLKTFCAQWSTGETGDLYGPIEDFDRRLQEIGNEPEFSEDGEESADKTAGYAAAVSTIQAAYREMGEEAEGLYQEANDIRDQVDAVYRDFQSYIGQLREKADSHPDSEDYKTVFLPEIELAESTCGELIKNMDIVLMGRQYLKRFAGEGRDLPPDIKQAAEYVIDSQMGETELGSYSGLENYLNQGGEPYAPGLRALLEDLEEDIAMLNGEAQRFQTVERGEIKTAQSSVKKAKDKAKMEVKDDFRGLNDDDIKIEFTQSDGVDWDKELADDLDSDQTNQIMQAGLDLIAALEGALEKGRDSLYINEYAVLYFPNYVQLSGMDTPHENMAKFAPGGEYEPYCASQAELEYVLTGEADGEKNLSNVQARLLAVRLVFNLVAIFTDSAKVNTANTIAAAAGPYAPLVSIGLLAAWALAESAMDIIHLMQGEEVLLFKQGANWEFSLEGGIQNAADYLVGEAAQLVLNTANRYGQKLESVCNQGIYQAYGVAGSGLEAAKGKVVGLVDQWNGCMREELAVIGEENTDIANQIQTANDAFTSQLTNKLSDQMDPVVSLVEDKKDKAILQVSRTFERANAAVKDRVNTLSDEASNLIVEKLSNRVNHAIPAQTGTNGGAGEATGIKLDYMDYMRIFLLFTGNDKKTQRIQQLIQANLRFQKDTDFLMENSYGAIQATMGGSIKFLFMGDAIIPEGLRQAGRLNFTVYSSRSY